MAASLVGQILGIVGDTAVNVARIHAQNPTAGKRRKKGECTPCAAFAKVDAMRAARSKILRNK